MAGAFSFRGGDLDATDIHDRRRQHLVLVPGPHSRRRRMLGVDRLAKPLRIRKNNRPWSPWAHGASHCVDARQRKATRLRAAQVRQPAMREAGSSLRGHSCRQQRGQDDQGQVRISSQEPRTKRRRNAQRKTYGTYSCRVQDTQRQRGNRGKPRQRIRSKWFSYGQRGQRANVEMRSFASTVPSCLVHEM